MSLDTRSKFYYNFIVEGSANEISFDEGSGEVIAEMNALAYTPTSLATEVARAMTVVGDNDYSCSFDRVTRRFNIVSLGTDFEILGASTTSLSNGLPFLGFDAVDTGSASEHEANNASGDVYFPQFLLQSYTPFENYEGAAYGQRWKTATGNVEDIRFGDESLAEMNITFITDLPQPFNSDIENDENGLSNCREFLRYITRSRPFEFMENRGNSADFHECILEKSQANRNGQGFKLKELFGKGAPNYYETGLLTLRKI